MRRLYSAVFALVLGLALVTMAPPADARVNSGLSLGSRGSRTYAAPPGTASSPYGASPMQRSFTPNGQSYGSSLPGGGYGRAYGMRPGSAFGSGLLGGLLGAGIGGLLFGGGFFGGMHGGSGVLGVLLQMFLLYMLGSWLYRRFAGNVAVAGGGAYNRMFNPGPRLAQTAARPGFFGGGRAGRPIALSPADYQSFDQLLHSIQAAWSAHDLNALGQMATPEMVGYFGEQLAEQTSRGLRNKVSDVRLQQGDLSEAWSEGAREYATVSMRFSMVDVTLDGSGRVADGSLTERVTVTEIWTFLRAPGGRWVLSAIQQAQ
jgi:predicted lipid-binding transport protein (Tim44 family)